MLKKKIRKINHYVRFIQLIYQVKQFGNVAYKMINRQQISLKNKNKNKYLTLKTALIFYNILHK